MNQRKDPPTRGYPEKKPDNADQARQPAPRKSPNPDEDGMQREPESDGRHDSSET